jgi:hypothetical protein
MLTRKLLKEKRKRKKWMQKEDTVTGYGHFLGNG